MTSAQRVLVRAWPWVLALLVLLPTLRRGFVLSYDMVFVPDLALRPDFLGLGSGLPRAIPSDAVVAVLDEVVPGMLLQKLLLLAALVLAGAGARHLVPADSVVAQLAATSLYVWNPYVAERLVIGHWPLLLAYGALPWVVVLARRYALGGRTPPALVLGLALGALSASGGVLTLVAALAFGGGVRTSAGRRRTLTLGLWGLAVNAPWLVAGLLHAADAVTGPAGVRDFAAGGEGSLPAPLAVLGLGGIWNVETVPGSRLGILGWLALPVLLGICALGFGPWRRSEGRRAVVGAAACAGFALVVALAAVAVPDAVSWAMSRVPGLALFRDGARYLGLLAVVLAPLFGHGAARMARWTGDRVARRALAVGAVLVPLALLPDLAWGVGGRLVPVTYPPSYASARAAVESWRHADGVGEVLVLPFSSYRAPAWNGGRKVLDPLGRYLPADYLASDVLSVSGRALAGEDPRAREVGRLLRQGTPQTRARALGRLGVGLVVVDRTAPGGPAAAG